MMTITINEIDKIEILTLQDNYVDLAAGDNTDIIQRAMPLKDMEIKNSVIAEHGFSAVITVTAGEETKNLLFDFGFSEQGAAFNADALGVDLSSIEALALSHGHLDHVGGLKALSSMIGKKGIELVVHPEAFRNPRYVKITDDFKVKFPAFTREKAEDADVSILETKNPYPLLNGEILFLGEIPRTTDFEKGIPNFYYLDNGEEKWDDILDDTAIVANVKGKGLVVISGCAHAGIINTVKYAQEITGIDQVFMVMGGFHLTGPDMEPVIEPTLNGLKEMNPAYIVPTHCTGRKAILAIENEMPDRFLLNMSGTKLTFAA
ncbi:MAG: MBL fold metallo-hydrolase [Deltaproteobacteria bacterium]|nr:MBL fold metallo-hydrolase [Deltaproteobacteria bacterium]